MSNPFLLGSKIYLRAPVPGDEVVFAQAENHPASRHYLYFAFPTSPEEQWEKIKKWMDDPHTVVFTIATINPDQPIGLTAFARIDWTGRMATFYIAIAQEKNWSKGYGTEATQLMTDYAFNTLNLHRIQLHVSVDNPRAVKTYQKVGFQIEGKLREAMYFDGRYHDFFLMSLLKHEWLELRQKK